MQTAIDRAFLPVGGRRIDLTEHLVAHPPGITRERQHPHHSPATISHPTARPYWAALITTEPTAANVAASTVAASNPVGVDVPADRGSVMADRQVDRADHAELADLAVVDLDGADADDRLGILAARTLRSGGLLAVLTRCRHTGDTPSVGGGKNDDRGGDDQARLVDPTGSVVAAAQNADLLYLQHIVIPICPLPDGAHMATSTTTGHPDTALSQSAFSGTAISDTALSDTALPGAASPRAAPRPGEVGPADRNSADTSSADTSSADTSSADTSSGVVHPADTVPAGADPADPADPRLPGVELPCRHIVAHADLLVFAQPVAPPAGAAPPGAAPAGPSSPGSVRRDVHGEGAVALQLTGAAASLASAESTEGTTR